jgi:predicted phage terminase large subunit-like protein
MPLDGTLIKAAWIKVYAALPDAPGFDQVLQSWDVASMADEHSDFSVCTTWGMRRRDYYLLDVLRQRLEFPDLLQCAMVSATAHHANRVLIEDASSGTALAQALRRESQLAVIMIRPKLDKLARLQRAAAIFEAGRVLVPQEAPWLADYRRELLGFPGGRHDDQVDATSQFLIWADEHAGAPRFAMPIIFSQPRQSFDPGWSSW